MLDLFQCIKQCAAIAAVESLVSPLVEVNSIANINVPRGVVEPSMAPKFYNERIYQRVLQALV